MNEEYYLFKRVDAPGAEVPKPPGRRYPPRVIFDVDPDIHARMRRAAKTKGLSLADYARQAALERLAKDPDVRKPVVLPARPPAPDAPVPHGARVAPVVEGRDPLYGHAIDLVVREGRGSCSLLQRKMGVGYGRAARMIDNMHEDGILGEYRQGTYRRVLGEPSPNGQGGDA